MRVNTSQNRLTLVILAAFLFAGGCSEVSFFYHGLRWLIPHYIDLHVKLDNVQKAQIKKIVTAQLDWHRKTQLPQYAGFLYRLSDNVENGFSKTELDEHQAVLQLYWDTLIANLTPPVVRFLATFSDAQIDDLRAFAKARNRVFAREYVDISNFDLRAKLAADVKERARLWLGDINSSQIQAINEWSRQYIPLSRDTLHYRRQWQASLFKAFEGRRLGTQFSVELSRLLRYPRNMQNIQSKNYHEKLIRNQENFKALLLRLDALMSKEQRVFLRQRLVTLAREFESLARE